MNRRADAMRWPPKDDLEAVRRFVRAQEWYHTLELAPGVLTPGFFDHRAMLATMPWPPSLAGMRCLDVGTFDGFWAFEMERRGADEVLAIDILDPLAWDWPAGSEREVVDALESRKRGGAGFEMAREMLGSAVRRIERSVYDLDPADVGEFDFVFIGSLLMHLRDPAGALLRVRDVCRGQLVLLDNIHLPLTIAFPRRPFATLDAVGRPWWWKCNLAALQRLTEAAGFEMTREPQRVYIPPGKGQPRFRLKLEHLTHRGGREALFRTRWGDPHAVLTLRPAA